MARLPTPGADSGTWGSILNDFILTSHKQDGSLKDNIIVEQNLDAALQAKVNTAAGVTSVAGRSGAVVLTKTDVGLANVDNTTDALKPVSTATQAALNVKANDNAVVHITGTETITGAKSFSQPITTLGPVNDTHAATKEYVDNIVDTIVGGGGTATWGGIIGTLSSQTDLNSALSLKANTSSLSTVATTGAYTDLSGHPTIPAQFAPVAGTNITLSGTYPNITFNASGAGVPADATTGTKGIVQLAGDLAGTAAAPTVPGLAGKANTAHTHAAADITSGVFAVARLGSGSPSASNYLRGDGTWAAVSGGSTEHIATNVQTTAYTLVIDDDGKAIEINASGSVNVTVPSSVSVAFPIGTVIEIAQVGTGQAVLVPGGGVTLRTPSSLATKQRWSSIGLRKRATDEWIVSGDLA